MSCVFDNPIHANGGCIFADPSEIEVVVGGGGGGSAGRDVRSKILQDDEDILAVIMAYTFYDT